MSEQPYMQLWIADYLGDTQHLSIEQSGCYMHLLMAMWRAGGALPYCPEKLARIVRLTVERWDAIAEDVLAFFDQANGKLTQKRLLAELEKARSKSKARSEAGKAGAEAKALKHSNVPKANAIANASANAQAKVQHSPEPESLATNVAKRERRAHALPPDWHPSANHFSEGAALGFSARQVSDMAEDLRLWAGAKGETKKNWDMAFSGWIRRENKTRGGQGPPRRPTKEAHFRQSVQEVIEEVDRGNIVEFGSGRRALCGAGGVGGARELHATAAGHENHDPPVDATPGRDA